MYLAEWRVSLPVDEVHVPRQLEGFPSSRRGIADWKEALPFSEVHASPAVSVRLGDAKTYSLLATPVDRDGLVDFR
jgi:hypothetical protein